MGFLDRRLSWLALAACLAGLLPAACSSPPPGSGRPKLLILGFDGMDPGLVSRWMREGQLPNISRLSAAGTVRPLATTHSPESPTAWASFATGVNPGRHNIYDFLVRDTSTYLPDLGMVRREPAKFLFDYFPLAKPKLFSIRGGTSFWVTAGGAGVRWVFCAAGCGHGGDRPSDGGVDLGDANDALGSDPIRG